MVARIATAWIYACGMVRRQTSHYRLVGADENGNIIGGLLEAGIPQTAKLSPMPQYSDLSDREMADIARWIHYSRMQGRYTELMRIHDDPAGDRIAGKTYYEKSCSTCHASSEMAKMVKCQRV